MERIYLKPIVQELIHKNGEPNVFFDVLSSDSPQEGSELGSLYVLGHIKYDKEDMGYLISLISSLAKREYYSENSRKLSNPKTSFEYTLKKLNEVLEEFFQNKKFSLNVGILAIAGDNLYISRLGKFKIFLGRQGELIDILNNVNLFRKDYVEEKEFSNIISGKVKEGDALFSFIPSRSLSVREKILKEMLTQEKQPEFISKIKTLSKSAKNFVCCAIHLDIKREVSQVQIQTKERPILVGSKNPPPSMEPRPANQPSAGNKPITEPESLPPEKPDDEEAKILTQENIASQQRDLSLMLRDVSLVKRDNPVKKIVANFLKIRHLVSFGERARISTAIFIFVIIIGAVVAGRALFTAPESREYKIVLQQARENLKLSQSYLNQNNILDARKALYASFLSLTSLSVEKDKNASSILASIEETLNKIDKVTPGSPSLFLDYSGIIPDYKKIELITLADDKFYAILENGEAVELIDSGFESLHTIDGVNINNLFFDDNKLVLYNGSDVIILIDIETQKVSQHLLKNPQTAIDSRVYNQNLYLIDGSSIYRYLNITKGSVEKDSWLNDVLINGKLMAIDGNIYILSSNGNLSTYFRGAKEKEFQLNVEPSTKSSLLTLRDYPYLVYIDALLKRIMVFDKSTGSLIGTYLANELKDVEHWILTDDGILYLLSSDQKIWKLDL